MTTFNVGDIVEVIEGAPYTYSTPGSWGVVTENDGMYVEVDFQYTPCGHRDKWDIRPRDLKLRVIESKEALIARKIATIYSRQRARGIAHV